MELSSIESRSFWSGYKWLKNKPFPGVVEARAGAGPGFLSPGAVPGPPSHSATLLYPTSTGLGPDPV